MKDLAELLGIRDFRYLWSAQVVSDFGDNLTSLTLLILVQRLTGSTVALAGLLIATTLPNLAVGSLSGVYVDRFDRKKIMVASDLARAVLVLGFVYADTARLIPLIYGVAFTQAAVGTLFRPARSAFLPQVVGERRLLAANSVSQTSRILFNLLGTTAAGVLAAVSPHSLDTAFLIDSATFLASGVLISRIRTPGVSRRPTPGGVFAELVFGVRTLAASPPLRAVVMSLAVTMLGLGSVNVLFVPFLLDDLGMSEALFGVVEASQVAGIVISGALVAVLAHRLRPAGLVAVGLIGVGTGVAAVAGVDAVWQLLPIVFAVGLFVGPVQAGASTLSQTLIDDSLRGRVSGVLNSVVSAANVASMGLAGTAAAVVGLRGVFLAAGIICALGGLVAARMLRLPGPAQAATGAG